MLKHKVVIEDREMKHVECGMTEEEILQSPEEIEICTQEIEVIEVVASEDKEYKQDKQEQHEKQAIDLQREHERKDPPIKPDRPPGRTEEMSEKQNVNEKR